MIHSATQPPQTARARLFLGAAAALMVHGAVLMVALHSEAPVHAPELIISEVDLMPEPPKVEPEPPKVEPEEPKPEPVAPKPAAAAPKAPRAPRAEPAAPPPAAAAPLHTAQEEAKVDSEPVRFAVDANGSAYGFGVVAQGGVNTGQRGGTGPVAAPAPAAASHGDGLGNALRNFAVPPRLQESDPCSGYFPTGATADFGTVTLRLIVSSKGDVREAKVLSEEPKSQGFGRAAVLCLSKKRFVPAQDESGQAQAAEAPVAVRFRR